MSTMNCLAFPTLLLCLAAANGLADDPPDDPFTVLHVAADGTADFRSIQAALDSIPVDQPGRVVIAIRSGSYNERVRIDHRRLTLRGEDREATRIWYNFRRSEYDRRYDRCGPGVVNVFGDDIILEGLTIENTQPSDKHAFALYGQPNRLILSDCGVIGDGGDTVSLWNTAYGMYYHRDCYFRGGVDFVCPRGWCYIRDSKFESVGPSAALWHDGHLDFRMKLVLRDCAFDGPDQFWLGRNHYPSQFYLLNCRFTSRMADKPIARVSEPWAGADPALWEGKYFDNCHRDGGDYAWHQDNLHDSITFAGGQPPVDPPARLTPDQITPRWTFDGQWDPESTAAPTVVEVDTHASEVRVYFSEPVAGARHTRVRRADGSFATLISGTGTRTWTFRGGNSASSPRELDFGGDRPYGTVATVAPRFLRAASLPSAAPRESVKLVLAGDSTVASYSAKHHYQGWGWALGDCFDDRVTVVNHARGGRSSKSFLAEGRWDDVLDEQGDYVIIQFGHNDNPGKGPERETDPAPGEDYRANLARYVEEARRQGAIAILVTPPTRRTFDADGRIIADEPNKPYATAMKEVASALACPRVELNELTTQLFTRLGAEHSDWLQPKGDTTHFTPDGARRIAAIVTRQLIALRPELNRFVRSAALSPRPASATWLPTAGAVNLPHAAVALGAKNTSGSPPPLAPLFQRSADDASFPPEQPLWSESDNLEWRPIMESTETRDEQHLNRWVTSVREPTLSVYPASGKRDLRTAIVVCPGGGYAGLAIDKEGHDTARWLNSLGVTAVVLKYRLKDYGHPAPKDDIQRAIAMVRAEAGETYDPDRIGVMGFSAGGHVASTAATHFRQISLRGTPVSTRPDFAILIYPVISMDPAITHAGSRRSLLGNDASAALVKEYSNELHVSDHTSPTFLVHTLDDRSVPVENSLRFYRALLEHHVPATLLTYERGGHGFGLVTEHLPVAEWPTKCASWLAEEGWLNE